jgi:hypothetical protein
VLWNSLHPSSSASKATHWQVTFRKIDSSAGIGYMRYDLVAGSVKAISMLYIA